MVVQGPTERATDGEQGRHALTQRLRQTDTERARYTCTDTETETDRHRAAYRPVGDNSEPLYTNPRH